LTSFNTIYS